MAIPRKAAIILLASTILLTGCADFWRAQGDAAESNAEARRTAAQAQRDNAQANIIDAQARGVLAESQAEALTTSVDAVVQLSTVDDKYAMIFAGLLFLVLGTLAGFGGFLLYRWSHPARQPVLHERPRPLGVLIETPIGNIPVIQEPDESRNAFFLRVQRTKRALADKEQQVISGYLSE